MKRFGKAIIVLALLINTGLMLAAFDQLPGYAKLDRPAYWLAYAVIAFGICAAAAVFYPFFSRQDIAPSGAFIALVGHGAALVGSFAAIYYAFGLVQNGVVVDVDVATAVYFSVVTWTTLGYGDFAPPSPLRLIVALEAILGLVFFGLFIGIAANFMHQELNRRR